MKHLPKERQKLIKREFKNLLENFAKLFVSVCIDNKDEFDALFKDGKQHYGRELKSLLNVFIFNKDLKKRCLCKFFRKNMIAQDLQVHSIYGV